MTTATHPPSHTGHGRPAAAHKPPPIDPEHDIDAKTTTIWVLAWTVVLFAALYFMLPLFDRVLHQERNRKVEQLPALELQEVVGAERAFLRGEESPSKKPIEQVMKEMVPR
jgi:hypothetical protein